MNRVLFLCIVVVSFFPAFALFPAFAQDAGPDSRVDILWESPDSYTPPFYKGKALPSDESTIRVFAASASFNPKTTTYTWTHNGNIVQKFSGINKGSFSFKHDILNNVEDVGVGLHAGGNIGDGSGTASIAPTTPSLIVYEKRDGFVDYTHAYTTDFDLKYAGTTLRIEPFFFSIPKNPTNDLDISFSLGDITPDVLHTFEIPIIKPSDTGTTTFISTIQSKISNWQGATLTTNINF